MFQLYIPCWLLFLFLIWAVSLVGFIFMWDVSLTHSILALVFLWGVSLSLTNPMRLGSQFFNLGSFSYTSRAGLIFSADILSVTHPTDAAFIFIGGVLHIPRWLHFLCGEFLLHIPCWVFSVFGNLGSSSNTSHTGFIFLWEVSLTHSILASFF